MAKFSRRSPSAAPRSPRFYPGSSSYRTGDLPNPFQDRSSATAVSAAAPVAADTVASSSISPPGEHSRTIARRDNAAVASGSSKSTTAVPLLLRDKKNSSSSSSLNNAQLHEGSSKQRDYAADEQEQPDQDQDNPLMYLTDNQREAAVENLDIETMDRVQTMRASIGVLTNSIKFRCEAELNRLPAAVRAMTVEEFWFTYGGNPKEYTDRQATKKTAANTSFLHEIQRVSKHSVRHKPYPDLTKSLHRHTARPFVDLRLGQSNSSKE